MNKKGFTLVELLAVIAVLGLIIGIATISISSIVKKSRERAVTEAINNLKDAATTWCIDNHFNSNTHIKKKVTTPCTVTVDNLITAGDFNDNGNRCKRNTTITVTVTSNTNGKEDYNVEIPAGTCK